jgi:hypothetical protein
LLWGEPGRRWVGAAVVYGQTLENFGGSAEFSLARLGNDSGLDVACAVHEAAEDSIELGEGGAAGDGIAGAELAADDEVEGLACGCRCVVEAGAKVDVVVVQAVGIEFDFGAGGGAAEEVDGATFANHVDGPLPCDRLGDGFDGNIDAAALGSESTDGGYGIGVGGDLNDF